MKEINAAYDQITKDRKAGRTGGYSRQSYGGAGYSGQGTAEITAMAGRVTVTETRAIIPAPTAIPPMATFAGLSPKTALRKPTKFLRACRKAAEAQNGIFLRAIYITSAAGFLKPCAVSSGHIRWSRTTPNMLRHISSLPIASNTARAALRRRAMPAAVTAVTSAPAICALTAFAGGAADAAAPHSAVLFAAADADFCAGRRRI